MSEFHVTLYGDDAERARELKERLNEALPGSTASNSEAMRKAVDLAEAELERRRRQEA